MKSHSKTQEVPWVGPHENQQEGPQKGAQENPQPHAKPMGRPAPPKNTTSPWEASPQDDPPGGP